MMKKVLVIGAERLTYLLDWARRDTAVLFGDGAGAVVIEASEQESGLIANKLGCDSEARDPARAELRYRPGALCRHRRPLYLQL